MCSNNSSQVNCRDGMLPTVGGTDMHHPDPLRYPDPVLPERPQSWLAFVFGHQVHDPVIDSPAGGAASGRRRCRIHGVLPAPCPACVQYRACRRWRCGFSTFRRHSQMLHSTLGIQPRPCPGRRLESRRGQPLVRRTRPSRVLASPHGETGSLGPGTCRLCIAWSDQEQRYGTWGHQRPFARDGRAAAGAGRWWDAEVCRMPSVPFLLQHSSDMEIVSGPSSPPSRHKTREGTMGQGGDGLGEDEPAGAANGDLPPSTTCPLPRAAQVRLWFQNADWQSPRPL